MHLLQPTGLCIKPGIQKRGTECGERGNGGNDIFWGMLLNIPRNVLKHSGECHKTFRRMSPNIPWNFVKYSGECHQIFLGMSPNIPGNVAKYSGECHQIFRGMSPNIPGNVNKHSGECRQIFQGMLPIFGVKGRVAFRNLSNIHDRALLRK